MEGCLNCRPLTYQGSLYDDVKPLRPIDFITRDIEITYLFDALAESGNDPDYIAPEEQAQLRTR
ncbi:hypothetical protein ANCDUO_15287 [Ancylostoma duodenale]|uniref:Uncharacterized protein n=1 Tax=Ancylostoma duodenale TaxID=51022 RepID=A0A0C2CXJ2_9BILA|nr:hypothetical protein ANCDUO_15287 [Ancylostoma duodenale]